jgi:hypothetical protein
MAIDEKRLRNVLVDHASFNDIGSDDAEFVMESIQEMLRERQALRNAAVRWREAAERPIWKGVIASTFTACASEVERILGGKG